MAKKQILRQTESGKTSIGKMEKKPGRKCKSCGKDPSPNYYYCPSCHHRVSNSYEEFDELSAA